MRKVTQQTDRGETDTHVQFGEEDGVGGAVAAGFRRLPELFLCRVSVHRTQFEKAVCGERRQEDKVKEPLS